MKYIFLFTSLIFINSCGNFEGSQTYSAEPLTDINATKELVKFFTEGLINVETWHGDNNEFLDCEDGYIQKEYTDWNDGIETVKITLHNCKLELKLAEIYSDNLNIDNITLKGEFYYSRDHEDTDYGGTGNKEMSLDKINGKLVFKIGSDINKVYECKLNNTSFSIYFNSSGYTHENTFIENVLNSNITINYYKYTNGSICDENVDINNFSYSDGSAQYSTLE